MDPSGLSRYLTSMNAPWNRHGTSKVSWIRIGPVTDPPRYHRSIMRPPRHHGSISWSARYHDSSCDLHGTVDPSWTHHETSGFFEAAIICDGRVAIATPKMAANYGSSLVEDSKLHFETFGTPLRCICVTVVPMNSTHCNLYRNQKSYICLCTGSARYITTSSPSWD